MAKNLTASQIDRQNILNNSLALSEIQNAINIKCIPWNDAYYLTKDMVATFFSVGPRTIERYIKEKEIRQLGVCCLLRIRNLSFEHQDQR